MMRISAGSKIRIPWSDVFHIFGSTLRRKYCFYGNSEASERSKICRNSSDLPRKIYYRQAQRLYFFFRAAAF